jgi:iron complex outermembrane receptor protein
MAIHRRILESVCAAALLSAGSGAWAQSAPAQSAAATTGGIEEIVVTAEKREEKLQSVPIAVAAFSERDLQNTGISSAVQLNELVSGLNIGVGGPGALQPFLRGVGNNVLSAGNEASVAMYVDNVYVPRLLSSFFNLDDVSRVEVLKGPQGTLFGRNASGGLINVITKEPSLEDYELQASVGYGNYDTTTEKLYASAPITDTLAGNISVYHVNQGDSWGRDIANGTPWGYDDPTILRSKWVFKPSDDFKVTAAFDYYQTKTTEGIADNIYPGTSNGRALFLTVPPFNLPDKQFFPAGFYDEISYTSDRDREEGYGGYVRLDYGLGFAKFSSISSLSEEDENFFTDGSNTPDNTLTYDLITFTRTVSEELQLASNPDSPFDWIGGLYYLNEYAGYRPTAISGAGLASQVLGGGFGPALPEGSTVNLFGLQRIQDYAVFGQATFHVLEHTNLTVGGRYTVDHVTGRGATDIIIPGIFSAQVSNGGAEATFYKPTYKVALDHHFTDDLMAYVSASRGFKAGTFNTLPLSPPAAKPEVLDAYEIGEKSTWLDHTLQLNASFFYYRISDPQVQEVVNHLVFLANAEAAEVKGIDIDGQYAITPQLIARFGAEYLDAHYTSFPNAPFILPLSGPPYGAGAVFAGDAAGNDLVNAPRFTFNVGLNYAVETTVGSFNFDTNVLFNGGFKWNPDGYLRQPAYYLVDASASYTPAGLDDWRVRVWGQNITGAKYATSSTEQAGQAGYNYSPGAPATYGVELTYYFSAPRNSAAEAAPVAASPPPAAPAPPLAVAEARRSFQVFFDFDKSDITAAAGKVIQAAADAVKAGNVVQITATGHTDTVGTSAYNQGLSERRAAAVKGTLVKDGVPGGEITTVGVGKTGLLVPTADGVREPQNRRAEIVLQ